MPTPSTDDVDSPLRRVEDRRKRRCIFPAFLRHRQLLLLSTTWGRSLILAYRFTAQTQLIKIYQFVNLSETHLTYVSKLQLERIIMSDQKFVFSYLWYLIMLPPPRRFCDRCCLSTSHSIIESISLKLDVMIGPITNQKNWLTFGGDPVPDMHSRSLFHSPHHCGIGGF